MAIQILALLYLIQLSLYGILQKIRELFALNALVYPPVSLVYTSHGRSLITPYQCKSAEKLYPASWAVDRGIRCPGRNGPEYPYTLPASYSEDDTPRTFMELDKLDLKSLYRYASAQTPQETRDIYIYPESGEGATPSPPYVPRIGSAVEFAVWMILNRDDPIVETNWNLDSDRGFGYKQWRGKLPPSKPNNVVEDETYDVYR